MRADRIHQQVALLEAEQRRLRDEGHRKIAAFAKEPEPELTDEAVGNYKKADALTGRINALREALEAAEIHDRADQKAAFIEETAARVAHVTELAEARIKVAAAVDKAFEELRSAFAELVKASNYIESQVRDIIRVRDQGLDYSRRGEKIAFAMMHAAASNPAFMEAMAQSVNRSLPLLAGSGLVDFKAPIGDPARANISMAAAADVAAHGLRQRLLAD